MASVDIVLAKPGSQKQLYGELSSFKLTALEPPLWAALLAAVLRTHGYSVVLYDAEVENWSYEETARKMVEADPRLAAVMVSGTNPSASTMNMTGAAAILRHVKEFAPHIKTILAGLHPSALPERTLKEELVDFVCQGEGVYTFPALLDALRNGTEEFAVNGLWWKTNGRICSNPRAPLVKPLDGLPMPAWDLLPMERYRAHNWHCFDHIDQREPYAVIYTSLGCPFRCSFCCINAVFGRPGIRYRNPRLVIEEIDYLVTRYNIKNIKILDEMFAMKESHVGGLCDLIIERGYDLNIWAYARVNTVTEPMLAKMKAAGINWLAYGFESGDKRILEGVSKGFDIEKVDSAVKMTRDAGIYICGNFMFGLPEDNLASMQRTLDMALQINSEWVNFQSTMAYPGSRLYEVALEEGWPLPETWQGFSQYGYESLPLPTRYVSGSEVLGFRDKAFVTYYTNPAYLDMITRKFGPQVTEHVREMATHKLLRKYC